MIRKQWLLSILTIISFVSHSVCIAQDDEFQYGLIGRYESNATGHVVERIDGEMAFHWNNGVSHPQIEGPFVVDWRGQLLVRDVTTYRFHAQVRGTVSITVDDEPVFSATSEKLKWFDGEPFEIAPGFQDIEIHYESIGDKDAPAATVKLFWSSEVFRTEPLSPEQLFHDEDSERLRLVEEGRVLFEAHRCHRCHRRTPNSDVLPGPALWGVTEGLNVDWLTQKLKGKNHGSVHDKMPQFGFADDEVEAIAAHLKSLAAPYDLMSVPNAKLPKGAPKGAELLHSIGCLACHEFQGQGKIGPFGGGDLSEIGKKRSPDWLATWLAKPERINPNHRMPVFELKPSERAEIVRAITAPSKDDSIKFGVEKRPPSKLVDRGRDLVKAFRCANCHKFPAIEADLRGMPTLKKPVTDWKNSCLSEFPDPKNRRPFFPDTHHQALIAYLQSQFDVEVVDESMMAKGEHTFQRRNCAACHRRGTGNGNTEIAGKIAKAFKPLAGKSQTMIPPSLNAIGDKLRNDVMDAAIQGDQQRAREDWLKVRMPKFQHDRPELESLKSFFVERDRIPSDGVKPLPDVDLPKEELYLTGRQLIGPSGFSCTACHQIGTYVPHRAAIGTRGADLLNIQKRLRPEFYHRWTRSPLRVVKGMEMPAYQKPVKGVLGDDVEKQLATLWKALGDPNFVPPTDPSQVEQLLILNEGDAPRVVRDVMTIDEANGGGAIGRVFAIGFGNQHSVLIDLDSMAVREWRFGQFARQRTVGKSWYWDLAGTNLVTGLNADSDFVLMKQNGDGTSTEVEFVPTEESRLTLLKSYDVDADRVKTNVTISTKLDAQPVQLTVSEEWAAVEDERGTGLIRTMVSQSVPDGYRLQYRIPKVTPSQFSTSIANGDGDLPSLEYRAQVKSRILKPIEKKLIYPSKDAVTTLPGYTGTRLQLSHKTMPTAFAWDANGNAVFTSLEGHIYRIVGAPPQLEIIASGLSSPFGVLRDGNDLVVAHKPELLRLKNAAVGEVTGRELVADGWGVTDNYHDWITGPVRDKAGNLFLGIGSDYSQPERDRKRTKWRGKILRINQAGEVDAIAHEHRYPIGIALDAEDRLFTSDQQGVQNTFNEINHVQTGRYYGVPSQRDETANENPTRAAVQIPHPWTRSVNGLFFLPRDMESPFAGHGIGCEYNGKFLMRFTVHEVNGALQGATYPFSRNTFKDESTTFLGPICGAVSPSGDLYIGSIHDSGWLGGLNTGEVVQLKRTGEIPNGIREVTATKNGFRIRMVRPVSKEKAADLKNYSITGYTRVWKGSYGTDNSGTYSPELTGIRINDAGDLINIDVAGFKERFVYELNIGDITINGAELFPAFAAYSMNSIPK